MSHWFFLSYARDKHDKYLNKFLPKFYDDLNSMIRTLTIPREGEDGFMDTEGIDVGEHWQETLSAKLQNCRVFISLYSTAYFTKEFCGKEWQIFSSRQAAYSAHLPAQASRPSLIMPVLWVPEDRLPTPLPEVASVVQYNHSDFGELYAQEGLQYLLMRRRSTKYHNCYHEFLKKFADKLINAARAHPLPPHPHPPSITEVESAFHRRRPEVEMYAEESVNVGPGLVQFIFVAGNKDELRTKRDKLDSYGDEGGYDWHPYLPEVTEKVGLISQMVACAEKLTSNVVQINRNFRDWLEDAKNHNKIVAIVVDTWTLKLHRYHAFMCEYDGLKLLNCVVIVAWNKRDEELTETERLKLESLVQGTFTCNFVMGDRNCFVESNSHDEFVKELSILLNKARQRVVERAEVLKKAEGLQVIPKPIINGVRRASA
jgi:FxsC-like protein